MIKRNNPKLHKTFWFWFALITPILVAIDLGFVMTYLTPKIYKLFSFNTINPLIVELRLPLAIAGLSIPLVAMVAAVHRSSQTAHQIAVQTQQNNFANHFKHLEEFKNSLKEDNVEAYWGSQENMHRLLYPNSKNGDLSPVNLEFDGYAFMEEIWDAYDSPFDGVEYRLNNAQPILESKLFITDKINSPQDITNIFICINKAYRFAALTPEPFHSEKVIKYNLHCLASRAHEAFKKTKENEDKLISYLTNSEIQVNPDEFFYQNLGIGGISFEYGYLYLWRYMSPTKKQAIKDRLDPLKVNYIAQHNHGENLLQ